MDKITYAPTFEIPAGQVNKNTLGKMMRDFEARISSLEKEMDRKNSEVEDIQEKISEL